MNPTTRLAWAVLLFLAGCFPNAVTTRFVYQETASSPQLFGYAAGGRDLWTVIHGNPTSAPKEEFDAATIAAMQGRNWGPSTNFTTAPGPSARGDYRVVLVFSGDRYLGGRAACGEIEPVGYASMADTVRLQAAFCYLNRALSSAHVSFPAIDKPDDPRLDQAVAQAVLNLFPPQRFQRPDGCPRPRRNC